MAVRSRFTRIPKVHDLIQAGVPTEVIATYASLADYTRNSGVDAGICWPRMETLARRLSRSPRTIQRHLHLLKDLGLVEFVERKRDRRGRFGAYVYRLVHIVAVSARAGAEKTRQRDRGRRRKQRSTTGHSGTVAPNKGLTKRHEDLSNLSKNDPKEGFWFLFGETAPEGAEEEHQKEVQKRREEEAERRRRGFEWFFD